MNVYLAQLFHVSFPGLGIHDLPISRVALSIGGFEIYWYGLIIALGFWLSAQLASKKAPRYGIPENDIWNVVILALPLSLIGARLYYVAFDWSEFASNPLSIFDLRSGGLAFYGGVLGGVLALLIMSLWKKRPFILYLDFLAPYLALGQAIGRWGNFMNQEAFGTNTRLPWGMISEGTRSYLESFGPPGTDPNLPVHPTFFYEFLGNLLIFFLLRKAMEETKKGRGFLGLSTGLYLLLYGLLRFGVEGLRTDALMLGTTGLRVSQLLSCFTILGALILLLWAKKKGGLVSAECMNGLEEEPVVRILTSESDVQDQPQNEASVEASSAKKRAVTSEATEDQRDE